MNFDSFLNIFLQERHKSSQFHGAYDTGWWLKPPLKLSVIGGSSSNFHDWWLNMHHMLENLETNSQIYPDIQLSEWYRTVSLADSTSNQIFPTTIQYIPCCILAGDMVPFYHMLSHMFCLVITGNLPIYVHFWEIFSDLRSFPRFPAFMAFGSRWRLMQGGPTLPLMQVTSAGRFLSGYWDVMENGEIMDFWDPTI